MENVAVVDKQIRPTKKQGELVRFVAEFIGIHGYGPSYREIMRGCGYSSVSTVAEHIDNLIARGHMRKRTRSARSLEVLSMPEPEKVIVKNLNESEEKWLVEKVELFFKEAESATVLEQGMLDQLYVLVGALKVLGLDGPAYAYIRRLTDIKEAHEAKQSQRFVS